MLRRVHMQLGLFVRPRQLLRVKSFLRPDLHFVVILSSKHSVSFDTFWKHKVLGVVIDPYFIKIKILFALLGCSLLLSLMFVARLFEKVEVFLKVLNHDALLKTVESHHGHCQIDVSALLRKLEHLFNHCLHMDLRQLLFLLIIVTIIKLIPRSASLFNIVVGVTVLILIQIELGAWCPLGLHFAICKFLHFKQILKLNFIAI